ncbi:MAG: hypothetical protein WA359_10550 [Acidimicrobiales bacterium]
MQRIPYLLLSVLLVLTGAFAVLSIVQSNSSGATVHVFTGCNDGFSVKPSTYVVSCADANSEFTDLHWYGWGNATAYATGEARWNDCSPTCVAGHWRKEAVTIWVWDIRSEDQLTEYTKLQTNSDLLILWGTNGGGSFGSASSS